MTVEHRLSFGLSDIVAVTFTCRKCGIRLSVAPEKLDALRLVMCPSCKAEWLPNDTNMERASIHPLTRLVEAIAPSLLNEKDDALHFEMFLEFAEPRQ
jgi:hypothetical protein